MSLQKQLEREIELIENDDTLDAREKQKEICQLEREAYYYAKEEARQSYEDTMEQYGYYEHQ